MFHPESVAPTSIEAATWYPLFVYGTLKCGYPNHPYWMDDDAVRFIGTATTRKWWHMSIGDESYGFAPRLLPSDGTNKGRNIEGELFSVRGDRLLQLDVLEGNYLRQWIRVIVNLPNHTEQMSRTFVYVGKEPLPNATPLSTYPPDIRYVPPHMRTGEKKRCDIVVPIPEGTVPPRVRLVVTADDMGVNRNRSDGILQGIRSGSISHTQLVVNGEATAYAAEELKKLKKLEAGDPFSVGLHFNITEGLPVGVASSNLSLPSSLVNAKTGLFLGKFGLRDALKKGLIRPEDIAYELIAQLARFEKLMGHCATHVDGHHHIHVNPVVCGVIAPILAKKKVTSVRIAEEHSLSQITEPFHFEVCRESKLARATYAGFGLLSTNTFLGLPIMGYENSLKRMETNLALLCSKASREKRRGMTVEVMTHVGFSAVPTNKVSSAPEHVYYYCPFSCSSERDYELTLYESSEWKQRLKVHQVAVVPMDEAVASNSKIKLTTMTNSKL